MAYDPTQSIFAGMTSDQLNAALANAQQAYLDLSTGSKAVDVSYTQGDSAKRVTFKPTDLATLAALIRQLQAQLGIVCTPRVRPLRFRFR